MYTRRRDEDPKNEERRGDVGGAKSGKQIKRSERRGRCAPLSSVAVAVVVLSVVLPHGGEKQLCTRSLPRYSIIAAVI